MAAGRITCRQLVDTYLARIALYDKQGPTLNAVVSLNPEATRQADALDAAYHQSGFTGRLHCVPAVIKDNLETAGWVTTAGTLGLANFVPGSTATAVERLTAAGAIILAKGNMSELAISALTTQNRLYGATKNPYDLGRVPAGSSGGVAVALAANFALVGLGTDTGNSVRGPAAHAALVGIRPTQGLVSRAGMIPLDLLSDTIGPMARSVEDASLVLDIISGADPKDPATMTVADPPLPPLAPPGRTDLTGVRLGLLTQAYQSSGRRMDSWVTRVFARALSDLSLLGATVETDISLAFVAPVPEGEHCQGLRFDLDHYLSRAPRTLLIRSFMELLQFAPFDPSVATDVAALTRENPHGPGSAACEANLRYRRAVRASLDAAMSRYRLDALVYPTWTQPPQETRKVDTATAGQSLRFAATAGLPAITVPMGFTQEVLPAGLSLMGRAYSEPLLLDIAWAYEQATRHRRPPVATPPIPCKCPF